MASRRHRGLPRKRRLEMLQQQCGICPYCGGKMTMQRGKGAWQAGIYATVDHVTPRAIEDLPPSQQVVVMCCLNCNIAKADRPLLSFFLDLHRPNGHP